MGSLFQRLLRCSISGIVLACTIERDNRGIVRYTSQEEIVPRVKAIVAVRIKNHAKLLSPNNVTERSVSTFQTLLRNTSKSTRLQQDISQESPIKISSTP
jgi:hypothetical protein